MALPFGNELSLHDQFPAGFGSVVVGVVDEVVAVHAAAPGRADTVTVLPLSADPPIVAQLRPKNAWSNVASIVTGLGVPGVGDGARALLPEFGSGVADGSSADAGLTPKNPRESNAIAHTPVKTATLILANRRSSPAPRLRTVVGATLGCERFTVSPI
jgi:hypothetical protein